ncbi:hypothetical protein [Cystobacter fuscus]|uniref:hypothetical protein n=1 Tax=Cystobacter fuscus TaxID=43 RepID=UPI002B30D767|nr:hypothetical protein F0U63_09355 [Cystobacter fuscus]
MGIKQYPVALILGTDVYEPTKVEERRRFLEAMLDETAPRDQWELILLAPEMETIFFQIPGLIEALGLPSPSEVQRERAKHQPRAVLIELLSKAGGRGSPDWPSWFRKTLPRLPHDKIWRLKPFNQLQHFLEQHQHRSETGHPSPR